MIDELTLAEDKKQQLDGNIKNMLSGGASQNDVMRYAADFKNKYGQKKTLVEPVTPTSKSTSPTTTSPSTSSEVSSQESPPLEKSGKDSYEIFGFKIPSIPKILSNIQSGHGIFASQAELDADKKHEEQKQKAVEQGELIRSSAKNFDEGLKKVNELSKKVQTAQDNIATVEQYPFMKDLKLISDQINSIGEPKTQEQVDAHNALVTRYNEIRDTPIEAYEQPEEGSVITIPDSQGNPQQVQLIKDRGAYRKMLRSKNDSLNKFKNVGEFLDANNLEIENLNTLIPQLQEAHNTLEKSKKDYQEATGYTGEKMGGWESFAHSFSNTLNDMGNELMPEEKQREIYDDKILREQLAPKEASGITGNVGELAGGLTPYILGGAVAGEGLLPQMITQAVLGGTSSGGAHGYEAYVQGLQNGLSKEDAYALSKKASRVATGTGALAFGALPLFGGGSLGKTATNAMIEGLGGSVAKKTATDAMLETLKHQGAIASIFGADKLLNNLYSNHIGLHKDLDEGVVEAMLTPVLLGAAIHGITSATKAGVALPKKVYDTYTTYIAKNKPDALNILSEEAKKSGENIGDLTPVISDVENKAETLKKMPQDMPFDEVQEQLPLMQEKEVLKEEKKNLDPAFEKQHEAIDEKINAIDEKIKVKNISDQKQFEVGDVVEFEPKITEPKNEENATTERKVEEGNLAEHQDGNKSGEEKISSNSDSNEQSGNDETQTTQVEFQPTPQTGKGEGDWSRDVESTAKALGNLDKSNFDGFKTWRTINGLDYVHEKTSDPTLDYIRVYKNGKEVGHLFYGEEKTGDGFLKGGVQVDENLRRKGVASRMYEMAEQVSGMKFKPDTPHSELANKLWSSKNRRFGFDKEGVSLEKSVSEAYHKAKSDGTNPELVKAVEDLLGKPKEKPQRTSTPIEQKTAKLRELQAKKKPVGKVEEPKIISAKKFVREQKKKTKHKGNLGALKEGKQFFEDTKDFTPSNIREYIMNWLAKGGKINSKDFAEEHFGENTTEYKKDQAWQHSEDAPRLGRIHESLLEGYNHDYSGNATEYDVVKELEDVINTYGDKKQLRDDLLDLHSERKFYEEQGGTKQQLEEAKSRYEEEQRLAELHGEEQDKEIESELDEADSRVLSQEEIEQGAKDYDEWLSKQPKEFQDEQNKNYEAETNEGEESAVNAESKSVSEKEKRQEELDLRKQELAEAETELRKTQSALSEDLKSKQTGLFENKEQKLFDDTSEMNKRVSDAKKKVETVKEEVDRLQKLVDEDLQGQQKLELSGVEQAKQKISDLKEESKKIRGDKNKLKAVDDPFEQAKREAEIDRQIFDAYVDLAKEYVKSGIKTVEDFAKALGEEVTDVLKSAWEKANEKEERVSGISHRVLQKMGIDTESSEGWSPEQANEYGKELLNGMREEGKNPNDVLFNENDHSLKLSEKVALKKAVMLELEREKNNAGDTKGLDSKEYQEAKEKQKEFLENTKYLGGEWQKAGVSFQGETDIDTGSFTSLVNHYEETHGRTPNKAEQQKLQELADENKKAKEGLENAVAQREKELEQAIKERDELEKKLKEAEIKHIKEIAELKSKKEFEKVKQDVRKNKRQITREELKKEREILIEELKRKLQPKGVLALPVDAIPTVAKLARNYVESGINNLQELIDQIHEDLGGIADKEDIRDAFSGFGKEQKEKVSEDWRKNLSRLKKEAKNISSDAKLNERFVDKDKKDLSFHPKDARDIFDYMKRNYLEKNVDYTDAIGKTATDLGLTPEQVQHAIASPKTVKKGISDEIYMKQKIAREANNKAKRYVANASENPIWKAVKKTNDFLRGALLFGHGTAWGTTHTSGLLLNPTYWKQFFPKWWQSLKSTFAFTKQGQEAHEAMMQSVKLDPNWRIANEAGLDNDPNKQYGDYDKLSAKLPSIMNMGSRGFDLMLPLRQELFNKEYNKLSNEQKKDPTMAKAIAHYFNRATGISDMKVNIQGKDSKLEDITDNINGIMLAPKLEFSRWQKLAAPIKALYTFGKVANNKAWNDKAGAWSETTAGERWAAKMAVKNAAINMATFGTALAINSAILQATGSKKKVNYLHPLEGGDWLDFQIGDHHVGVTGGITSVGKFVLGLANLALTHSRKERGGETIKSKAFDVIGNYASGKLAPGSGMAFEIFKHHDFNGNTLPMFDDKPDNKHAKKLTWAEYFELNRTPIPVAEAFHDMHEEMKKQGMSERDINVIMRGIFTGAAAGITGARIKPSDYESKALNQNIPSPNPTNIPLYQNIVLPTKENK